MHMTLIFSHLLLTTVNSGDVVDIKSDGMHKTGKSGLLIGIKGTVINRFCDNS